MIIALRLVFAAGLIAAIVLALSFLVTRDRSRLRLAIRVLVGTCVLGLAFFAVLLVERMLA